MKQQSFLTSSIARTAWAIKSWDVNALGPLFYVGIGVNVLWMISCCVLTVVAFPSPIPMFVLPVGILLYLLFMFIDERVMGKYRKLDRDLTTTYFNYRKSIDSLRKELGLEIIYKDYEPRGTYDG